MPLAFHLTGGEASDSRNFELLLDLGPDIVPRAAITDKGYDAKANRDSARKRGVCPVIPYRATATDRPAFFPKILYKARARIEQAVGKLKRFKRIALRCEKPRAITAPSSRSLSEKLRIAPNQVQIDTTHFWRQAPARSDLSRTLLTVNRTPVIQTTKTMKWPQSSIRQSTRPALRRKIQT